MTHQLGKANNMRQSFTIENGSSSFGDIVDDSAHSSLFTRKHFLRKLLIESETEGKTLSIVDDSDCNLQI